MAAEGDIQKLIIIFRTHKLNFWCRVFDEYRILKKGDKLVELFHVKLYKQRRLNKD